VCGACGGDADCPAEAPSCLEGLCRQRCRTHDDCTAEATWPICSGGGLCVECRGAEHCGEGFLCIAGGRCVADPERTLIAIAEGLGLESTLSAAGYRTRVLTYREMEDGALTSGNFDALFVGRFPNGLSDAALAAIEGHVLAGRGLVTEFSGAILLFSSAAPGLRFADLPQTGWFTGSVGGGHRLGDAVPVQIVDRTSPLMQGISTPFSALSATEFFFTLYTEDPNLRTVATFRGDGSEHFPARAFPAAMEGRVCDAPVLILTFDYQDNPADPAIRRLITNAAAVAAGRVDLSLPSVCPRPDGEVLEDELRP